MAELDGSETRRFPEYLHFGDVFTTRSLNTTPRYVITDVGSLDKVDTEGIAHFLQQRY